jgi:nucleotide-binding universal stress UspA family protein
LPWNQEETDDPEITMKVMVLCDGSSDPRPALNYGISRERNTRGELVALHVIRRMPNRRWLPGPELSEKELRRILRRLEETRAWIRDQNSDIRTSTAFSIIKDHEDILRYARDTGVDLIVAPSAYESLFDKACYLVDIVADEEEAVAAS